MPNKFRSKSKSKSKSKPASKASASPNPPKRTKKKPRTKGIAPARTPPGEFTKMGPTKAHRAALDLALQISEEAREKLIDFDPWPPLPNDPTYPAIPIERSLSYRDYRPQDGEIEQLCTHPTMRNPLMCREYAVGLFSIPADYNPSRKHQSWDVSYIVGHDEMPLCLHHANIVQAAIEGREIRGDDHTLTCRVCNHPDQELVKEMEEAWLRWEVTSVYAAKRLNVHRGSWGRHTDYYKLWERKASKPSTMKALILAAERGFSNKGYTPKVAIEALRQLASERGDIERVDVRVASIDLTRMSDEELTAYAEKLALQLKAR